MRTFLLLTVCAFAVRAEDIYISQPGAGSGVSCVDARSAAWFNTVGNWGGGAGEIDPGDTVHLCGTITTGLVTQAAGTLGNATTIRFEDGAKLSAAVWNYSTGAIRINHAYITVDGGTNGVIENTANGTGLANHTASAGIVIYASNVAISGLAINNIYIHTQGNADVDGDSTYGIYNSGQSNVTVSNVTVHDTRWAFFWTCGGSATCDGFTIENSTAYNFDHGVGGGDNGVSTTMSNWIVRGNNFYDMAKWDTPAGAFHHNHIHVWTTYSGSTTSMTAYNNYFHGDWGDSPTASINNEQNVVATIYNNLMVDSGAGGAPYGCVSAGQGSPLIIVNNTCVVSGGVGLYFGGGGTGLRVQNNVISGASTTINVASAYSGTVVVNNNDWYPASNMSWPGSASTNFTVWKAACSCDADSITSDPLLSGSYTLGPGSPAIGAGANLSALGITALNSDKNGVARGSTWDIGAYEYAAPPPPTTLRGTMRGATIK